MTHRLTRDMPFGVVWDLDGVIVATTEHHFASWRALLADHGMPLTYDQFLQTFGSRSTEMVPRLWGLHGRTVTPGEAEQLADDKERWFREHLPDSLPLLPGVFDLAWALDAAGAQQAIATLDAPGRTLKRSLPDCHACQSSARSPPRT